jgi:CHASE2 domain-containing sensor protein
MSRPLTAPLLTVALLACLVGLVAQQTRALAPFEAASVDLRFALRGHQAADGIAIVAIDEDTLSRLGSSWPIPRSEHAQLIDRLREAGVRRLVYDVQFTEPSGSAAADTQLFDAVRRMPGVVLATGESDEQGRTAVLGGPFRLAAAHAQAGASNFPADDGGVIRRYPDRVGRLPSIATLVAAGLRAPAPAFSDGTAWIDFRGPPGSFPTYSFADVLDGRVGAAQLRGRIVVVGATAPTIQDVHPTATSGDRLMAGAELQANAIWTALHGNPLRDAPPLESWLLILGLALAGPLLALRRARLRIVLGLAAVQAIATQGLFALGVVVPYAAPAAALATGAIGSFVVGTLYGRALEAEVRRRTQDLRDTQLEVVERLAAAAELRDHETGAHIDRMSRLCERVGLLLGMPAEEAELLRHASVLHDVGKLGTPDVVLRNPGRLSAAQREEMQRHAELGARLLAGSRSPLLQLAEEIARTHHERWDGTGYPGGLRGEQIPLAGRIAAACDTFDALVSERPYKPAWSVADAVDHLLDERGRQFDPMVVDALIGVVGTPAAQMVRGRTAG